jgi:predicted secreted protein
MGWFTGTVVFLLTWWILLFTVLPFGHERDEDGTPKFAHMKKKFIWTTIIACIVWVIIYLIIDADIISFREMAQNEA